MNNLIQKIVNEVKLQIFTEEEKGDKQVIAIYPGRFQPMGRHHKLAYDWLAKQFGVENTYIVTSDKTEPQRSPLNFAEKKSVINKHGIKNVVKVRSPYLPSELLQKFDPKKTVVVYMVGEKDKGRLGGFKRLMKYNKTTLVPYKDIQNPYAYYVHAPHISVQIPSFGEMSGTNIRKALGDREAKLSELKQRFKDIMGWFDPKIFNTVIAKMNSRRSKIVEHVDDWMRSFLNMTDIQAKMFFDIVQKEYGDTKDLMPILRKFISGATLSPREKVMFQKQMKDTLKLLGLGAIAAIPIPGTMLLIPVVVQLAKKFNINLLPENNEPTGERLSIVRREFWDKVFEEVAKEESNLLQEGGAAGHMRHLFDDMELTFGDLKNMFKLGLSGKITTVSNPSEKLDGQNLLVTFKNNQLYAARNKGDIIDGGMTYDQVVQKFEGRGEIQEAFSFAVKDLQNAIMKLSQRQQKLIFKNGKAWMNLEIMYPKSTNVINYDGAYLVFHGSSVYDKRGEKVEEHPEYARILAGMIQQVNANTQEVFSIEKPKLIKVAKAKDYREKLKYFVSQLTALQRQMNCNNNDTISLWHQRWWERYIKSETASRGIKLPPQIINALIKRWAFYDKSFPINKNTMVNESAFRWAKEVEQTILKDQLKKNLQPFETLVLRFGAEVLKNVSDVMALNPKATTRKIKSDVQNAIDILSTSDNPNDLKVLKTQLERLKSAGGINAIVPLEGIAFTYNGKTYKLTGVFAPINQLLGHLKFKR